MARLTAKVKNHSRPSPITILIFRRRKKKNGDMERVGKYHYQPLYKPRRYTLQKHSSVLPIPRRPNTLNSEEKNRETYMINWDPKFDFKMANKNPIPLNSSSAFVVFIICSLFLSSTVLAKSRRPISVCPIIFSSSFFYLFIFVLNCFKSYFTGSLIWTQDTEVRQKKNECYADVERYFFLYLFIYFLYHILSY